MRLIARMDKDCDRPSSQGGAMKLAIMFLAALVTSACDQSVESNNSVTFDRAPPLKGYEGIEFGSSFNDALGSLGGDLFNSAAVSDCFRDLPLRGCYLSRNTEGRPYQIKDGIPYTLSLSFNRFDRLTDIGLKYDREGEISRADCLGIHERTLDWVTREFGPLRFHHQGVEPNIEQERRGTSAGNLYEVGSTANRFFVTAPMRTSSATMEPGQERRPIPEWDNERYVSLISTFIIVDGTPICSVNVDFREPASVERPTME